MNPRKLTDADVLRIRTLDATQEAYAAEFGVSTSTISRIQRGEIYRTSPWPDRMPVGPGLCPRCRSEARYMRQRAANAAARNGGEHVS